MLTVFPLCVYMVPLQSLLPKINEHLPPEIRVIGESTYRTLLNLLELINPTCTVFIAYLILQESGISKQDMDGKFNRNFSYLSSFALQMFLKLFFGSHEKNNQRL